MNKITERMVKYLFAMNLAVALVGFLLTSFILPKIYINNEYKDLEKASEYVLEAAQNNTVTDLANISAVLINDGKISNMCRPANGHGQMGQMGQMAQMKSIDFESIRGKEIFKSRNGDTYIGLKKTTDYGDIVVYKSYEGTKSLIKSVNLILISIFLFSLIVSTLIASYLGNKFTKPIIILQKRASNISKGIYKGEFLVNTGDEIQELNDSIDEMAKELEIKDNMQKEFIANVSHDLKTPLSVIRANSEVIKDGLVSGEEVNEYASNIIKEVDNLTELVSEILTLSRLKDNNKLIKLSKCSLKEFIEESHSRLICYLKNDENLGYKLELKIDDNLINRNIFILIDKNYLFRVISNFFINAMKHSGKKDGSVLFRVEELNEDIKVSIRDYGKGIDSEELKYIWDRYYKGEKSGGMGLGLAISKEIILAHGFKYGVESEVRIGSDFYFIISKKLIEIQ
jgi:signal transduction histidine kinase